MSNNNHINYIEFKFRDLEETKAFYSAAFDWEFTYYGPNYVAFSSSGLDGGFEKTTDKIHNVGLVVLFHDDLEASRQRVINSNGTIFKEIFSPGGKRFEFIDPSGNELAVWTELPEEELRPAV